MRTRFPKRTVALLLAVALCAWPSTAAAVTLAGKVKAPASGAYVGVYRLGLPWSMAGLSAYRDESSAKTPAIVSWYQSWGPRTSDPYSAEKFLTANVESVLASGSVPMITWEPWNPGADPKYLSNPAKQPAYQLSDITSGKYDSYIRSWARSIKAMGGPVMLRPMHEMNGNWYPWCGTVNGNTPARYRSAWRRIHALFRQEGATNVTWVWSPNAFSVPNTYANRISAYYPGDAYVDWVGLSGFNWGTSRSGGKWKTFAKIYDGPLTYLKRYKKPIMIAEMGSVEKGGDKAAWIRDAYARIRLRYPRVKAVVYFDKLDVGLKGRQDWQITSSIGSARAYRSAVSTAYYVGGPLPALTSWQGAQAP